MKKIKPFYVINYDINAQKFIKYDIMPYLTNCYKTIKNKEKKPKTLDEFKKFVEKNSLYMYWARCEYEIILLDWPCQKDKKKIDIHWQIMNNIDVISEILFNHYNSNTSKKTKKNE